MEDRTVVDEQGGEGRRDLGSPFEEFRKTGKIYTEKQEDRENVGKRRPKGRERETRKREKMWESEGCRGTDRDLMFGEWLKAWDWDDIWDVHSIWDAYSVWRYRIEY